MRADYTQIMFLGERADRDMLRKIYYKTGVSMGASIRTAIKEYIANHPELHK